MKLKNHLKFRSKSQIEIPPLLSGLPKRKVHHGFQFGLVCVHFVLDLNPFPRPMATTEGMVQRLYAAEEVLGPQWRARARRTALPVRPFLSQVVCARPAPS